MILPFSPYYIGMVPPITIPVQLQLGDLNDYLFNSVLEFIDSASFEVQRPDGTTASWSCEFIVDLERFIVELIHTVQAGDFTVPGTYSLFPKLILSSNEGTARFQTFPLTVLDPYQLSQPSII